MEKDPRRCKDCNRWKRKGKDYCYFCDPDVPESEKAAKRGQGGRNNRKIPSMLVPGNYRPLTAESLKRLYEDLIDGVLMADKDDFHFQLKELAKILPRIGEVAAYTEIVELKEEIRLLKANRVSYLIPEKVGDYVIGAERD